MEQLIEITQSLSQDTMKTDVGGGRRRSIHDFENLFCAWLEFRRGKRGKPDVQSFEFNLEDKLFELHEQLAHGKYIHEAYESFFVADPKLRHIHKASVRDRVFHQAVFRILYSIFDPIFIFDSYSCRIGKGTHRAVDRLESFCSKASANNSQNIYALKCDVRKFFDSVDHEILLQAIRRRIIDSETLQCIELILNSFSVRPGVGLPLGNVTSQLFANIYLNELDQFVRNKLGRRFYMRYCDDFVVLLKSHAEVQEYLEAVRLFLDETLHLDLHPNKIIVRTYRQGIDFLGYVVRPYCRTLRTKTKRRVFKRVSQGISDQSFQSYMGVLSHCNGHTIRKNLLDLI